MDLYSVKIPEKLDPELEERGKKIELELAYKGTKDVEDFGELPDEVEDDEKKFGTANPLSDANYQLFEQQVDDDHDEELYELERRQRNLKNNL